jgi:REP element-mobilizing transposase RayT
MMKYDPTKHHRRSIRLKGYDYSNAGAYFVTICTQDRACVLDDPVVNGIINTVWQALPMWFPTILLDEFVVMPNHVHFILRLTDEDHVGATLAVAQDTEAGTRVRTGASPVPTLGWVIPEPEKVNDSPALSDVVGAFKSLVFKVYLDWAKTHDPARRAKFWQHNYYEHIIRNDHELNAIAQYIRDNPVNWQLDRDNLQNSRCLPSPVQVKEYLQDIQEMNRITL